MNNISFDDMKLLQKQKIKEQEAVCNEHTEFGRIEITEEEKNIIRYCVEEVYEKDIERGHELRAEITKAILDKLIAIKKKEEAAGTFNNSYFF